MVDTIIHYTDCEGNDIKVTGRIRKRKGSISVGGFREPVAFIRDYEISVYQNGEALLRESIGNLSDVPLDMQNELENLAEGCADVESILDLINSGEFDRDINRF